MSAAIAFDARRKAMQALAEAEIAKSLPVQTHVGGYRVVDTTTDRDNIPASDRQEGMLVYVIADSTTYKLSDDLLTWIPEETVKTTPQSLTDSQQIVARQNLLVPSVDEVGGFPIIPPRTDSVATNYAAPAAGTPWGMSGAVSSHTVIAGINLGNDQRLCNSGTITDMEWFVPATLPVNCKVRFYIFRQHVGYTNRWGLVDFTADLRSLVTANDTVQKVTLPTPLYGCQIGDCIVPCLEYTSGSWGAGFHTIATPKIYSEWTTRDMYYAYSPPLNDGIPWEGGALTAGVSIPVIPYMQAPLIAIIGDSRIAGFPFTRSLLNPTQQYDKLGDIAYRTEQRTASTVRNLGIEGNTTTMMEARFATDVLAAKPTIVIIYPGCYNDLYHSVSVGDYTTNIAAMVTAALADGVKYVMVCSDMPFADPVYPYGSANICIQNVASDTRCSNARAWVTTQDPNQVWWCDLRPDLGEKRPSNYNAPAAIDPDWKDYNIWDLKQLFWNSAADRLHMNEAGASQMSRTSVSVLRNWLRRQP